MATLHVRNVPDPLYALLRETAETEGRSIGAQALVLLRGALGLQAARSSLPQRLLGARRFTEGAAKIVERARAEARALDADKVEPGHILLALLAVDGSAHEALARAGVDGEEIRERLGRGPGSRRASPSTRIPFSKEAKAVLERALREALALKHSTIVGEHVLLALADDPLLAHVGAGRIKAETLLALSSGRGSAEPSADAPDYLAVDLAGDAHAWTVRLNELATDGWELLQILDRRAVLRRA